jgi:hypothetical protein
VSIKCRLSSPLDTYLRVPPTRSFLCGVRPIRPFSGYLELYLYNSLLIVFPGLMLLIFFRHTGFNILGVPFLKYYIRSCPAGPPCLCFWSTMNFTTSYCCTATSTHILKCIHVLVCDSHKLCYIFLCIDNFWRFFFGIYSSMSTFPSVRF